MGSNLTKALERIARGPFRSSLFHWLYDHHDEITATLAGSRIEWAVICAGAHADGVTDVTGKPATEETARKTWYRVRLEVRRRRWLVTEARQTPVPDRLRAPLGWRPSSISASSAASDTALPKVATVTSPPVPAAASNPVSLLERPKSEARRIAEIALTKNPRERTPAEKLAILRSDMESRSGR